MKSLKAELKLVHIKYAWFGIAIAPYDNYEDEIIYCQISIGYYFGVLGFAIRQKKD